MITYPVFFSSFLFQSIKPTLNIEYGHRDQSLYQIFTKIHYIDILEYIIYKVNIAKKLVKIVSC